MFLTQPRSVWINLKSILIVFVLCSANRVWATPPLLKVSGNQIVTSSGCSAQLKGVDVDGLEFSNSGYGPPNGGGGNTLAVAQEAVTGWQASIIRLPLNQDSWFGCGGANQANYQAIVASIVNYCSSMNVYVILDLHWSGESSTATEPCGAGWGNDNNVAQQYMADQNAVTFWSSVAAAYANNPAVFFDLYNEPFSSNGNDDSTAWNVWAYGGTGNGASFSTPGMQALLNAVRNAGAQNICLIGGLGYASDLTQIQSYPFTNAGNGIVYSTHLYGNTSGGDTASGWDSQVPAALRAASPVFVGEIGPYITCNGDNSTYDNNMFAWVNGTPGIVGATAWSLTTSSCPNLLTDWTWDRSSWGNAVFNWLSTPFPVCSSGPTPTPVVSATWRVNAGGPAYTDTQGNVWAADENYSGGTAAVTTSTITGALPGAADQVLYQSQRYGNPFSYSFNVPAGNYQITMKFAETYWTAAGQRVFNVSVNGNTVLTNFDIFATTGGQNKAIDEVFNNIAPSGGVITITFGPASADNAMVDAIQIIPQPGTPTFTPTNTATPTFTPSFTPTSTPITLSTWRVNAGGPQFTDTLGNVWAADENYTGGTVAVTTSTVTGAAAATDAALYQTQRYGAFSYSFNVPAGNYQVSLLFAETYWAAAGDREFNVSINGNTVLTNFDIFATAGGENIALVETFNNIVPSGGVITLTFGPASVNYAVVQAIQIIPQPSTATSTATFSNTPTNTFSPTNTGTSTATASRTPTLTFTSTTSSTFTNTATFTWTNSFSPTATQTNSNTPTSSFTPSSTSTWTVTLTPSNSSTASFTSTSTVSSTATHTPVGTSTPVNTNTAVNTASPTPSSTATSSSTASSTPTSSFSPTGTASHTPTTTDTLTFTTTTTHTPTKTSVNTASPTGTPTATTTPTNTQAIPTSTQTYTLTPSSTVTNTVTVTNTFSSTPTATATDTNSFTATGTSTPTWTLSFTFTPTATATTTWTNTSTWTATAKIPTASSTFTMTPTYTPTAVPPTASPTATVVPACSGIPAWNGNFLAYAVGQKVSYNGEIYQCLQAHTSEPNWMPPVVPALWKDLGPCGTTPTPATAAVPVVYPNPATSSTTTLQLPETNASNVTVQIFTVAMRLVQTLHVPQVMGNSLTVSLMDKNGVSLANGLYYFVVQAGGRKWMIKVLILR